MFVLAPVVVICLASAHYGRWPLACSNLVVIWLASAHGGGSLPAGAVLLSPVWPPASKAKVFVLAPVVVIWLANGQYGWWPLAWPNLVVVRPASAHGGGGLPAGAVVSSSVWPPASKAERFVLAAVVVIRLARGQYGQCPLAWPNLVVTRLASRCGGGGPPAGPVSSSSVRPPASKAEVSVLAPVVIIWPASTAGGPWPGQILSSCCRPVPAAVVACPLAWCCRHLPCQG